MSVENEMYPFWIGKLKDFWVVQRLIEFRNWLFGWDLTPSPPTQAKDGVGFTITILGAILAQGITFCIAVTRIAENRDLHLLIVGYALLGVVSVGAICGIIRGKHPKNSSQHKYDSHTRNFAAWSIGLASIFVISLSLLAWGRLLPNQPRWVEVERTELKSIESDDGYVFFTAQYEIKAPGLFGDKLPREIIVKLVFQKDLQNEIQLFDNTALYEGRANDENKLNPDENSPSLPSRLDPDEKEFLSVIGPLKNDGTKYIAQYALKSRKKNEDLKELKRRIENGGFKVMYKVNELPQ